MASPNAVFGLLGCSVIACLLAGCPEPAATAHQPPPTPATLRGLPSMVRPATPTIVVAPVAYPVYPAYVPVVEQNLLFQPPTLQIPAGTVVVWQFQGPSPQGVSSEPNPSPLYQFYSGEVYPGATFSVRFAVPGTYPYHDPMNPAVRGEIVVQ